MSELSGPLAEFLALALPQEAGAVHKSYPLVPTEDIEQEMWAGVLRRRESFERLIEQGAIGVARRRLKEQGWKIVREDDRYRRAVRAASAGYRPADEQFYTVGVLKLLIPMYLDNGVTEAPPKGREVNARVSGGGGGSDYMAMMLDVDHAMKRIRSYHSEILRRYFEYPQGSGGYTHLEISGRLGIDSRALEGRIYRALRAMRKELGGRNPWNRRALEFESASELAA